MKVIKLIIIFVVILGGVVGAFFLLTDGEKDFPGSSPDTSVFSDTTAIGDTGIIEDATDKDNRITDPQDEEEIKVRPKKSRPKQKAVINPSESKQSKNAVSEKAKTMSSERKKETKHIYTCKQCGDHVWFKTKIELNHHMDAMHREIDDKNLT